MQKHWPFQSTSPLRSLQEPQSLPPTPPPFDGAFLPEENRAFLEEKNWQKKVEEEETVEVIHLRTQPPLTAEAIVEDKVAAVAE